MLRNKHFRFHFVGSLLLISQAVFGQGCSDAGICTLNTFKPENGDSTKEEYNVIRIGLNYGRADHNIQVAGSFIDYTRLISKQWELGVKLTSLGQWGNQLNNFGLSDVYLTGLYKANSSWKLTASVKVPLTQANKKMNNLPLPMDYQSSLGTLDAIIGATYQYRKWKFQTGVQQPLTQNKNAFQPALYSASGSLSTFVNTNQFTRKGDAILRVSRVIPIGRKFKLTPGLLSIYHFSEDTYVDSLGSTLPISGSNGLTLNGTLFVDYRFAERQQLQLNFGTPFIVRDVRPDGLTRSLVINLQYSIHF